MDLLQTLRHSRRASRWLVLWFLAALGVAAVAPLVHAQPLVLVCTAAGSHWVHPDTGSTADPAAEAGLSCPFCLPAAGPVTDTLVFAGLDLPAAIVAGRLIAPDPALPARRACARGPPQQA
jgi:hypothetical protein